MTALKHQVIGGAGYFRLLLDHDKLYITGVKNPLSVYMDPDTELPSGQDAIFCLVEKKYRTYKAELLFPE